LKEVHTIHASKAGRSILMPSLMRLLIMFTGCQSVYAINSQHAK